MRNSLARRVLWVHVILLLALCGVLLRIFVIGQGEQYRQTAAAQSRYTLSAGTARGNIYDCRLRPLVNESEKTVLAVDPTPAAMTALRQGLSAEQFKEIYPLLQSGRPVLLPSDFPISGEGITALQIPQRYSADQLAPHIIGYINGEGRGICGIESGYEEQLTRWGGEITVRYTVNAWRQATGQAPEVTDSTDHTAGIVLTLDKDLQTIVEREGAVLGRGAVVLLEAETGAICAMASFPGYDVTDVAAALEAADSPLLNRATAAWNVGSIFKVCVAAAALENEVELPENYCCEGFYRLGDRLLLLPRAGGPRNAGFTAGHAAFLQSLLRGAGPAYRCPGPAADGPAAGLWGREPIGGGRQFFRRVAPNIGAGHSRGTRQPLFWPGQAHRHPGTGRWDAGCRGQWRLCGAAHPFRGQEL